MDHKQIYGFNMHEQLKNVVWKPKIILSAYFYTIIFCLCKTTKLQRSPERCVQKQQGGVSSN